MSTKKIKFSGTENAKYMAQLNVNDYSGRYSLYRINGLIQRDSPITPESVKFLEKKPDVVMVFPDVKSLESIIDGLIDLRTMMLAKKGIAEEQEIPNLLEQILGNEIQQMSPEEVIQTIRSKQREEKGRLPGYLRPLMGSISKLEKVMSDYLTARKVDKIKEEQVKETVEDKAEPATT